MAIDYTTSAGRVRMLVGDTNESSFMVSDDEITALLALNSSDVYAAAADACRAIAASAARCAVAFSCFAGELNIDKSSIPKMFLKLAEEYQAKVGLTDTTDYCVDWNLLVDRASGKDETSYNTDDNEDMFDNHFENGE